MAVYERTCSSTCRPLKVPESPVDWSERSNKVIINEEEVATAFRHYHETTLLNHDHQ